MVRVAFRRSRRAVAIVGFAADDDWSSVVRIGNVVPYVLRAVSQTSVER